jgi:hypothetical protein
VTGQPWRAGAWHWIARCAWCDRYRFGRRWLNLGRFDAFAQKTFVTHTVCPECFAELEADREKEGPANG